MTEKRSLMQAPELRAAADKAGPGTLTGYAAVFDSETDIGGYFREVFSPGAFTETLKTEDVRALVDHDNGRLIGRKSVNTLRLSEDARGLKVEIDLPDTSDGRDLATLVARGDLDGMSFAFIARKEVWDETIDPPKRTILAADLREVSAVTFPAYADTSLALRARDQARDEGAQELARRNAERAAARIAERKAAMDQKFRGIDPKDSRA